MSKGQIVDYHIKINPSEELRKFIADLHEFSVMPENILKIYENFNPNSDKKVSNEIFKIEHLSAEESKVLTGISIDNSDYETISKLISIVEAYDEENDIEELGSSDNEVKSKTKLKKNKGDEKEQNNKLIYLELNDIRWINEILIEKRKNGDFNKYLHEFLEGSKLILPKNELIPRNPELEARCRRLRQEQEAQEYRNMTKNVDAVRQHMPEDTIAYQIKAINRQMIAVLQFIFSVIAGFAFGFIGVELIIGNLDFGFRLLLGTMCALIIALAEIYFLAKKLNEYDEIPKELHSCAQKPHQD